MKLHSKKWSQETRLHFLLAVFDHGLECLVHPSGSVRRTLNLFGYNQPE
jgi:hypothetical protein